MELHSKGGNKKKEKCNVHFFPPLYFAPELTNFFLIIVPDPNLGSPSGKPTSVFERK